MNKFDEAMETTLAKSFADVNAELQSFGRAKGAKLKYLQAQYKSGIVIRRGVYLSIPTPSEYRSKSKAFKLRMQPHQNTVGKTTTSDSIAYHLELLRLMMIEDELRPVQPTITPEDNTIVRRLPIVSFGNLY